MEANRLEHRGIFRRLVAVLAVLFVIFTLIWQLGLSGVRVRELMAAESTGEMSFVAKCEEIDQISVSFDDWQAQPVDAFVNVYSGDGSPAGSIEVPADAAGQCEFAQRYAVPEGALSLEEGETYHVSVTDSAGNALSSVSVLFCGGQVNLLPLYVFFCLLLTAAVLFVLFQAKTPHFSFPRAFFLCFLLLGLVWSLGVKPYNAPDEQTHFAQAYALSSRMLGKTATESTADGQQMIVVYQSGLIREKGSFAADESVFFYTDYSYGNDAVMTTTTGFARQANLAFYSYLPSALGISLARLLHLPWQFVILFGRMAGFAFLGLMAVFAMYCCPKMRTAVAAICFLPKTVWIGTSCSYDIWNLAFVLLYLSLVFRISEQEEGVRLRDLVAMALSFLAFLPVKFVYGVLGLCIFLIPSKQWKKHRGVRLLTSLVVIGALVILVVSRGHEVASYLLTSDMDRRGFNTTEVSASYTLSYCLHHPGDIVLTFVKSVIERTSLYLFQLSSGHYLRDYVPHVLAFLMLVLFLTVMMKTLETQVSRKLRLQVSAVFVLGVLVIEATYLFVYTVLPEDGIAVIDGVQGRYFLPYLYLLPVMLQCSRFRLPAAGTDEKRDARTILLGAMVLLHLAILFCKVIGVAMDPSLLTLYREGV